MKVKQLIEELSKCNPEAVVEIEVGENFDSEHLMDVIGVENEHPAKITLIVE